MVTALVITVVIAVVVYFLTNDRARWLKQPRNEPPQMGTTGAPFVGSVKLHDSLSIGDHIKITLTDIKPEANNLKYRVWATVFVAGFPEMQIRNAQEGYVVKYPEEHGYTIELVTALSDAAKFSIGKNP